MDTSSGRFPHERLTVVGAEQAAEARKAKSLADAVEEETDAGCANGDTAKAAAAAAATTKAGEAKKGEKSAVSTFRWSDEADLFFVNLLKKHGREKCAYKERSNLLKVLSPEFEQQFPEFKSRSDPARSLSERLTLLQGNYRQRRVLDEARKAKGEPPTLHSVAVTQIDTYIAILVKVLQPVSGIA